MVKYKIHQQTNKSFSHFERSLALKGGEWKFQGVNVVLERINYEIITEKKMGNIIKYHQIIF